MQLIVPKSDYCHKTPPYNTAYIYLVFNKKYPNNLIYKIERMDATNIAATQNR